MRRAASSRIMNNTENQTRAELNGAGGRSAAAIRTARAEATKRTSENANVAKFRAE